RHCEVVFHDLSGGQLEHTIIAIENGHVTGRSVGGPSTNLGLEVLHDETHDHDTFGYRSRTQDGREMRSSSVYFRDGHGRVIASLCINVDLTGLQLAQSLIADHLPPARAEQRREETFAGDISQVLEDLIERAVTVAGKPVGAMDREDKMAALAYLDRHGAFFVKRAMDRIASRLGMSRVTAYKYLELIRANPDAYGKTASSAGLDADAPAHSLSES
ncbi:MAG: helix-turn-helix transcriptional regulator, partial [Micromonosporaceae bacterium]